jgi:hypothetical protein
MKSSISIKVWVRASLAFAVAAAAAFVLIWGSGPLLPGAGAPTSTHSFWSLPGWLALVAVATLLLATPAAIICAVFALKVKSDKSSSSALLWVGCLILVFFLLTLFG